MIKYYLKIAWRNITTRKFYTFLNISGLAIAISCCIFIYLYTSYNLSFDNYHSQSKNIFRLVYELHLKETEFDKGSSFALYKSLKTEFAQVRQAAFSCDKQSLVVTAAGGAGKRFKEENNVSFTDAGWFNLFSYKWLAGNPAQLDGPGSVVLRQKTAGKYFGSTYPIGKMLLINNQPLKVTGVIADGPYNTDLKGDLFISASSLLTLMPFYGKDFFQDWGNLNSNNSTFILLGNPNQRAYIEKQLIALTIKHLGKGSEKYFHFKLLPLNAAHFDTRYGGSIQKSLLWNLGVIGLLVITIAVFNYINLTVARQTRRTAEIATRKILGGNSRQIFMHFITESLLTSLIALITAFLLVLLLLPAANTWLFADEPVHIISYAKLGAFAGIVLLFTTISTGLYPAWLLSRVSIAKALKNSALNLSGGIGRKVMVVFQNTVTQSLIVATIVIAMQVYFLKNTAIGFDPKSVIIIPTGQLSSSQKEQFSESLRNMPAVQSFSNCRKPPESDSQQGATIDYDHRTKWETWPARFAVGDSGYCGTFGLQIIAGRNIRNNQPTPEFLVNQTMAARLEGGHPENVIGKNLTAGDTKGVIVGIVRDFNIKSLIEPIEPSIVLEDKYWQTNFAIKFSGNQSAAVVNALQKAYQPIFPDQVFSYQFVDEQIAALYKTQSIQQKLIWIAASVAILICALGLFGLVSLIALQRTREISIRKVLGATVTQVSLLLSNDFLRMVLTAFLMASFLSWWIMNNWLQGFAYRITIYWWIFALAGGISILITVISVGYLAIKAAFANPAEGLRSND
jgi:putative ABC transport system permease protein